MKKYYEPELKAKSFNCPHCGVYAQQKWSFARLEDSIYSETVNWSICNHCGNYTIWFRDKLIYPLLGEAPIPHEDMPNDVKIDYEEARAIVSSSPRGAVALLRLAVQKLCKHLGEKGKNINEDIKQMVAKNLSPDIQKSLDIVRVIGNNAVHPGQIDVNDNREIAIALFGLINEIVENKITRPKRIDDIYDSLPESSKKQIEERDNNN